MGLTLVRLRRFAPALGAAAVLLFPTTALAADTIQATSAQLIARGVEVDVTVSFTCTAGDVIPTSQQFTQGGLTASIQEAVSKTQQASGFGSSGGQTCTGSPQTAVIQVISAASGPPFKVGPALITPSILECLPDFSTCTNTGSGPTTVRITK
jgi:hypothetical protein